MHGGGTVRNGAVNVNGWLNYGRTRCAAAGGQLNRQEMARAAIELVRKYQPLYLDLKYYREDAEKWFADRSIVEQLLQGLRELGLKDFTDSSE
jgi:hypothetical protein